MIETTRETIKQLREGGLGLDIIVELFERQQAAIEALERWKATVVFVIDRGAGVSAGGLTGTLAHAEPPKPLHATIEGKP